MLRRQPRSTRSDTLFPDTTLFRSRDLLKGLGAIDRLPGKAAELYAWLVDNPQVEGESDGKFAARKLDAIKAILEVRADGIGPAVAEALGDFFHEPHNRALWDDLQSEEHTSELQSLMRISYAVFCLKNKPPV